MHTKCPDCGKVFSVKKHLKYRVQFNLSFLKLALRNIAFPWIDGMEEIFKPDLVVCPQCYKEFSAKGYKYFGLIEAKHLQVGLIAAFLFFVLAPLAVIIWHLVK
jgi:hypothetical protein